MRSLVTDLFFDEFSHKSKNKTNKHDDMIVAFNSTSRYLDNLLNIDNIPFDMVHRIYPDELQLNKVNDSAFLGLNLSINNYTVSKKI